MQNNGVLIVANDFTTIHHFRMELLERLNDEGYTVTVALPKDSRNEQLAETGSKVIHIPMSRFGTNPLTDLKTMLAIRKVIRDIKPAVVLTYTAKANIYGGMAAAQEKIPYVCTVTGLGVNFAKGNLVSKIMLLLYRLALKKAQAVFFQNDSNRELFARNHVAVHNGKMIAGSGVNLQQNAFTPYPDNAPIRFISVARIRQDKGYDELFAVVKKCHEAGVKAEFHIVGWYEDKNYQQIVEQMQNEYGVKFYNYVPHGQMHGLIAGCDCLIQPSHHEGMSNVILEAAAIGRPCIVSNISGCKEGVCDGETGFLFRVKDPDDLFEKVCAFLALPKEKRAQLGWQARHYMENRFDRQTVVQQYIEEIQKAQQ